MGVGEDECASGVFKGSTTVAIGIRATVTISVICLFGISVIADNLICVCNLTRTALVVDSRLKKRLFVGGGPCSVAGVEVLECRSEESGSSGVISFLGVSEAGHPLGPEDDW